MNTIKFKIVNIQNNKIKYKYSLNLNPIVVPFQS